MRTSWLPIALAGVASGLLYFFGAAVAALIVGFDSYVLGSDLATAWAVWAGPVVWALVAMIALRVAFARRPGRILPIALSLLAGPVIGYLFTNAVAGARAKAILAEMQSQAESQLIPALPFALPVGSRVVGGSSWGKKDASLTFVCDDSPRHLLAYFRENLPPTWRQCRQWESLHAFVSPRKDGLELSISVDLLYEDRTRFTLSRSARSVLWPDDLAKLCDLKGNSVPDRP